jgi:four helix bundle protein
MDKRTRNLKPGLKASMPSTQHQAPNTQNPAVRTWKDLEVWKLAHSGVLRIYEVTKFFPSDERFRLIDQLCRAAASVPANIAEGKGRSSLREYLQFLSIARGSVEEVKYFVLLAKDLHYLENDDYEEINADYDRVGKMLNGLMTSLRTRLPKPKT